jgi:hypothetical protein
VRVYSDDAVSGLCIARVDLDSVPDSTLYPEEPDSREETARGWAARGTVSSVCAITPSAEVNFAPIRRVGGRYPNSFASTSVRNGVGMKSFSSVESEGPLVRLRCVNKVDVQTGLPMGSGMLKSK